MSYPEMALDVMATLDSLALDQVVLVGHSIGGKVAQAAALLHPDRVAGLVVMDMAPVDYDTEDPSWKAVLEIIHLLNSIVLIPGQTRRDVDTLLQASIPDPALRAFVMTNFDPKRGGWKVDIQSVSGCLDTLAGFGLTGRWEGDALFINGGQSRFVRHAHMESIAGYFPNHMLTTIRGVGHWVHAEAPDDTLALLKRYLDR
jgi:esterase